jgi:hypothetical protein
VKWVALLLTEWFIILEIIAWFAWHRHGDPFTTIDDTLAENTTVHFIVSALVLEDV